jgi:hypothetical protein
MSQVTPRMRECARQLIACEASEREPAETKTPVAFAVCEKLRSYLAVLLGEAGFAGLLSRALALARAEVSGLRAVYFKADGSFEGLEGLEAQVEGKELAEGGVVLVAQLLRLLAAFIGEDVTLRLLRQVWPKLPIQDLKFGNAEEDEEAA